MVPWPEMMTTVTSGRRRFISASVSNPSLPGIQISRKARSGTSSVSWVSASAPLPTAVTRYPSSSRTPRSADWIAGSSSTIRMCSPAMGHSGLSGLHGRGDAGHWQLHDEATAPRLVVLDPDDAAVLDRDLVHDGQAQPHAVGLRREVG